MATDIVKPPEGNITSFSILSFCIFIILFQSVITACSLKGGYLYRHSFHFDLMHESPGYQVLDYQYGSSKFLFTVMDEDRKNRNESVVRTGTYGYMPKGEFLYVKWQNTSTGEIFEDRVDLTNCYPSDITDYTLTFFVKGPQLYVYLISPYEDRRPKDWPKGPMSLYSYLKQYELYPNRTDLSFLDEHPVSRSRR